MAFQRLGILDREIGGQRAPISNQPYGSIFLSWSSYGIVAFDPQTSAYLQRSRGRGPKSQYRYSVQAPNGNTFPGSLASDGHERTHVFGFMANNIDEAVEKANKLFPKKFEQFTRKKEAGTLPAMAHFLGVGY